MFSIPLILVKRFYTRYKWSLSLMFILIASLFSYNIIAPVSYQISGKIEKYGSLSAGYIIVDSAVVSPLNIVFENNTILTKYEPYFNVSDINKVMNINGVVKVYKLIRTTANWRPNNEQYIRYIENFDINIPSTNRTQLVYLTILGLDLEILKQGNLIFPIEIDEGHYPENNENALLLSKEFKEVGFKVGDYIKLQFIKNNQVINVSFKISGFYISPSLPGSLPFDIIMDYDTVITLYSNIYDIDIPEMSSILILEMEKADPKLADKIKTELQKIFENRKLPPIIFYYKSMLKKASDLITASISNYILITYMINGLIVVLPILIGYIDFHKGRRDIGLLLTLGWEHKEILFGISIYMVIICLASIFLSSIFILILGGPLVQIIIRRPELVVVKGFLSTPKIPEPNIFILSSGLIIASSLITSTLIYFLGLKGKYPVEFMVS